MPEVSRKHAEAPLVLALDIGSSATRGRVYDAAAQPVKKLDYRVRHTMKSADDGTNVADADQMLEEVVETIDYLIDKDGKHASSIAGVALDTFAATLVGVNESGKAVTPVYTYADSRPAAYVTKLQSLLDEQDVQQRTGCRFHASYLPARLLWLADTQSETLKEAAYWMSLGEYIYFNLLGKRAASYSTAAWSGLLDRHTLTWDAELLQHLPIHAEQLSPLHDTSEPIQGPVKAYAKRWPEIVDAAWFPAIADGYASNIGSGAVDATALALSMGTSGAVRALLPDAPETIPSGLWCYAVNRKQSLLGGALNDGGRAIAWLRALLALPSEADLLKAVKAPASAGTPIVLPFLTGERSPGWAGNATASFTRMDLGTTPAAIFRGMCEGVAFRMQLIAEEIRSVATESHRVVASGGGVEGLPDWLQILADMIGLPVALSNESQATLHGTAEIALDVLTPATKRSPAETGAAYEPNGQNATVYTSRREAFLADYENLILESPPAAADPRPAAMAPAG